MDNVDNKEYLIIGSKSDNFIVVLENEGLEDVTYISDGFPVVAIDGDGNTITFSGEILTGPRQGEKLLQANGMMGYFFALAAFYDDIEIYN